MKENEFVGKVVVSMADSAQIGKVKDLVFRGLQLSALVVKGERGEGLLPFTSIGANGPDAITIEAYTQVEWNAGSAMDTECKTTHELGKLKVMDDQGNMIGHMHDLTINDKGQIQEISVKTDGVFGIGAHETLVPSSKVRGIGNDLITVESAS